MQRNVDEFWKARPSQVLFCIQKYKELINNQNNQEEITEITSMKEIQGWGCHG